jgi:hypothetical protein
MPNVSQLLTVAALTTGLNGDRTLEYVQRAQYLLGCNAWSEVVRIGNSSPNGHYPRIVNALIFQLDSALWFYTPTDGTQSLSHFRGRVEADKRDLGPLLAAIDPGFTRWEVLPETAGRPYPPERIPNGCFIESMAILFQKLANGARIEDPRLLSYYVALPGGIRGHTVLQFTQGGRILVVDPDKPTTIVKIRYANQEDPMSVVSRMRSDAAKARYLPLREFLDRAQECYSSVLTVQRSSS